MRKKILIIPIVLLIFIIGYTIADNLDNDSRVALNSDLIYYLSVIKNTMVKNINLFNIS